MIGSDCIGSKQVRQELVVSDVLDFCRHNCLGILVKLFAGPVRVLLVQLVNLIVVLTHEQCLHCGEVWVLRSTDIASHEHTSGGVNR